MKAWRHMAAGRPAALLSGALLLGVLLPGCALLDRMQAATPLNYRCPHDLRFTARLYRDMATLDGMRGHAVLARVLPDSADTAAAKATGAQSLRYADDSVRAEFGLGEQGRLVRLDYTNIPEPVYCVRGVRPGTPLPRPVNYDGPRPPPPRPDPDAPTKTNLHTSDGQPVRGE